MKYSTPNLPLHDAPPASNHQRVPLAVDDGSPARFSCSGGGKATVPSREARVMAQEAGEHVEDVFMMQGGDNGGSSSNTRHNQFPDHDGSDVKKPFILDSGASVHCTGDRTVLSYMEDTTMTKRLRMANGSLLDIAGRGTVRHGNITVHDVLFAPGLSVNIVSVPKLVGELDYTVEFRGTSCFIWDAGTGDLVGKGKLVNGLYELDFLNAPRT